MNDLELLEERALTYRFFSNVFLVLLDEAFVKQMLVWPADDDSEGGKLIAAWAVENAGTAVSALVTAVSVDRTRLFRGLTADGPVPPYESLFLSESPDKSAAIAGVAGSYAAIGFEQTGGVHDSPDYLGNEFAFMDRLLTLEMEAVATGNTQDVETAKVLSERFLSVHLGRWAERYTREMEEKAETDLYRGLALAIRAFMAEEAAKA